MDLDTGKRLGPGEDGEIRGRSGNSMMLGYLARPKETEEYFDSEGYGRTGDLVRKFLNGRTVLQKN